MLLLLVLFSIAPVAVGLCLLFEVIASDSPHRDPPPPPKPDVPLGRPGDGPPIWVWVLVTVGPLLYLAFTALI